MKVENYCKAFPAVAVLIILSCQSVEAFEPPVLQEDSISTALVDSTLGLPDLKALRYQETFYLLRNDSTAFPKLPPVPRGFFCRFEDIMQQKWKIPLNLELK